MQLIPSEYMREYLESVNFTFTDFQRATLIWNLHGRKSMYYKEVQDSWSICDYRTYQAEAVQMTPKDNWKRYYFRK